MKAFKYFLISSLIIFSFISISSKAIIPTHKLNSIKEFLPSGSFRGGSAGVGFSILSLKRVYSTDGHSERLIFEIGDKDGHLQSGNTGYFHAQLFRNPSQFSLDFSQLLLSKVSSTQLKKLISKSKLIQNADLTSDFEDHSTNVSLQFKAPIKMRVFTLSPYKKSAKLVVDFTKM